MIDIAILGSNGAVGSALYEHFDSLTNYNVFGLDLIKTEKAEVLDILDPNAVKAHFSSRHYDKIINCIGSYSNVFEHDLKLNVIASNNLLKTIKELNDGRSCQIILMGSSAEYGIPQTANGAISEEHPLNPINSYGLTKKMQFDLFTYYRNKFDMDILYIRPFNIISEKLSPKLFIGNFFHQIDQYRKCEKEELTFGYLGNYRDYIDVNEFSRKVQIISENSRQNRIFNIGTGVPKKMHNLLSELINNANLDKAPPVQFLSKPNRIEVEYLYADVSRLKELER